MHVTANNITEQFKTRNMLARLANELKESNLAKDKLFSVIAHDLRGPLGSMVQMLGLLTGDIKIDEPTKDRVLHELEATSKHSFALLENLLKWARMQKEGITFNPEPLLLSEIAGNAAMLLASQAKGKSINVRINGEATSMVSADRDSVETIFRNLLSNAIKFTRQEGSIDVDWKEDGDFVRIEISDNGIGMNAEMMANLFKLTIISTWGTNGEKGTGLGLVLVKEFVEGNGGELTVTSKPGEGSTFSFTLPKVQC